ncbi:putative Glycerol dehydrogenase [Blattamonas nauphoetae]|uniref:Glycerol dehydrogenase n=1 Tax=Blattamonas nauphoetae TaxID=2049346 RepID=A0ABQ9XJ64_9EUKA|nr:putative Glycerol dehydrogenase [Blattamonas nauphoetae]
MTLLIQSPSKYIQRKGAIKDIAKYSALLGKKGAYIIVTKSILQMYRSLLEEQFKTANFNFFIDNFNGECCQEDVDEITKQLSEKNCDVVVGIGGGKVMDTAKAVAYFADTPTLIVPTIASSDAPCSALSVLYKKDHTFDKYLWLKRNPDTVLVDTEIIANAPVRFLIAGVGDALATFYEARACSASRKATPAGGITGVSAMALATACRDSLFADAFKAIQAVHDHTISQAVENIIETNTYLSGIGFESGGLAAAHAFHNGLTIVPETGKMLHGEKVAFGVLVHLVLENADEEEIREVIEFCRKVGLPTNLKSLGIETIDRAVIRKVAELTCAEGESVYNMPFPVNADLVESAILVADRLGSL